MRTTILSLFLIAISLFFSFSKPKYSVPNLGKMKKTLKQVCVYIPPGKTVVDSSTVLCAGFFMSKTEICNSQYTEYLLYLKKRGKMNEYNAALPDTAKWHNWGGYNFKNTKYTDYYFNHPAYRDYPVVNITREQAEHFCEWLTERWRNYSGNETVLFRLPTRAEFLRAANGSSLDRPYAWSSPYLRNDKGKFQGNFLTIGAGIISRDTLSGKLIVMSTPYDLLGNGGSYADITAPVQSYWPNEFGIYHLNGNVAEMVEEKGIAVGGDWTSPGYDIRNQSTKKFTEANPTVGFRMVMTFVESENAKR